MSSGPQALSLIVCAVLGLLLATMAQAKSAKAPQKRATPPASSPIDGTLVRLLEATHTMLDVFEFK